MPNQLVCRPEQAGPVAVLRINGTLDQLTGDALKQAIRLRLATQPNRLLLDVTDMHVGDPLGLSALSAAVCETAEWPNVPIVVCGADESTRGSVTETPDCEGLAFSDDCDKAIAESAGEPVLPRVHVRLRPVPDACRQVRTLVTQACAAWHRADLAAVAALIATELVANVVRHAHTTMEFTLTALRDGRLSMTVRDHSRRMPRPTEAAVGDAGGRGLKLVRDLTDAWGVLPVSDGKVVWTQLNAGPS
ncbi:ATP-binding protein [Actinoplanes sp. NPDC049596]|uniref:ATP-binding protein n=1 Tax=unclassified Actinoplanes TaxID=2626549 RepID=UPI00342EE8DE